MTKHQKSNSEKKQGGGAKKLTIEQRAENFKKSIWEEVKGTERESQTDELRKFWEYYYASFGNIGANTEKTTAKCDTKNNKVLA